MVTIVIDGFFRGVCPILEPGETITSAMGYVLGASVRHETNFQIHRHELSGENCAFGGSPAFLMG